MMQNNLARQSTGLVIVRKSEVDPASQRNGFSGNKPGPPKMPEARKPQQISRL